MAESSKVERVVMLWMVGVIILTLSLFGSAAQANETVWLSSLDLSKMSAGWGSPQVDKSVQEKPLTIAGRKFDRGVGTHAESVVYVELAGGSERFTAYVGVDDEVGGNIGSIEFCVYGDGKLLWTSGVMKAGQAAKKLDVDVKGVEMLFLVVNSAADGMNFDHANWAEAQFVVTGSRPKAIEAPVITEEMVILTPRSGPEPRINGPSVYGCRPGRPFIYRVPCTGTRPIVFGAENLPSGLTLDKATGIISGKSPGKRGKYLITLTASNAHGKAHRVFKIVVGDTLALTPPMGWNHWYTWYDRITDGHLREAADVMVASGMADFGYQYVNIDDCWMIKPGSNDPELSGPDRDEDGTINTNARFPDMKAMTGYIHSKGLKAGLYTSPGPKTCAGFVGSYQHEQQDAETFAEWGFDFLKYDWCSYGRIAKDRSIGELQKPYIQMGDILRKLDRDIIFNLCQYGMGNVWEWGGEVGGHCWRTTGDLGLARGTNLPGFYHIGLSNAQHWEHARPGQWNDPDYILIGYVGNARRKDDPPQPTKLTGNEQYSYMSMWCLMASPLFYSGDMARLDEFTLNVLCNAEVIEVDQDALGRQGRPIRQTGQMLVLAKPMEDGSLAVGLFNISEIELTAAVRWSELGITGRQRVRDLWRQKDIGIFEDKFQTSVPRHGVVMLRLFPASMLRSFDTRKLKSIAKAGIEIGSKVGINMDEIAFNKDENNYRQLTEEEERVIIHKGTEPPFSGEYDSHFEKGQYTCRRCGAVLFDDSSKFRSTCGWPSFDDQLQDTVKKQPDADGVRTEIICAKCGGHLGHVFTGEGYTPKNTRYCVNSISLDFAPAGGVQMQKAIFASGCFWGTQHHFQKASGVVSTKAGYTGGCVDRPTYEQVCTDKTGHAEVLEVTYDPAKTSYEQLARLFFETHDFTQLNRQGLDIGTQYRSALFYMNEEQKQIAQKLIETLRGRGFDVKTQISPAGKFWPAEEHHQDYYKKTKKVPTCQLRKKLWP